MTQTIFVAQPRELVGCARKRRITSSIEARLSLCVEKLGHILVLYHASHWLEIFKKSRSQGGLQRPLHERAWIRYDWSSFPEIADQGLGILQFELSLVPDRKQREHNRSKLLSLQDLHSFRYVPLPSWVADEMLHDQFDGATRIAQLLGKKSVNSLVACEGEKL